MIGSQDSCFCLKNLWLIITIGLLCLRDLFLMHMQPFVLPEYLKMVLSTNVMRNVAQIRMGRFKHLKVWREADFSCPRAVNKKAVTYRITSGVGVLRVVLEVLHFLSPPTCTRIWTNMC